VSDNVLGVNGLLKLEIQLLVHVDGLEHSIQQRKRLERTMLLLGRSVEIKQNAISRYLKRKNTKRSRHSRQQKLLVLVAVVAL
jgi:hypothetical protein